MNDVGKKMLSNDIAVHFKCHPVSDSLISDVVVTYDASRKTELLQRQKGESYEVSGRLSKYSETFGLFATGE